ncbi:hypothetical protein ATN37_04135 [Rhodococcus sp. MH15]|nr:hypothetical protein [Rhodococcus sp. MH15]
MAIIKCRKASISTGPAVPFPSNMGSTDCGLPACRADGTYLSMTGDDPGPPPVSRYVIHSGARLPFRKIEA